ncbi:hypothetical protein A2130_00060 [Candidatus Woesebacteria bacterium GWC2_33_12]|uniref:Beta-lactamase class A catalytic domain-containing protein n=1 Tax=Candidatus Woesebacteria bacterium GW2011_GWB1_33_22 TaxID=1618566 RepID=A0A0G0CN19_9BACT|nr:MAG: hypothetical protein UR29_C0010G0003 [Candidatus Woesebacteria bacterium GW2011_GWC2_33_12]KKP42028.1 MAG: hypothetical protein UR33_C0006G0012 [Candidatus Woesebacteria bacterium GW2011_GWA2_33_20]KKP44822.1 MAG: hypothetical protein UR35_C0006G0057 [Candidatus Woesebacteria bacterium GW2011_GWB1_33_22]KKP46641.1 MAG: hypothetical protein UR37_C0006G0091 [Microgenomates group bacterium GW2011_GWC1_33_28]KKP50554.1 MAG: hypothetical protein UR41_C0006G0057 [Candidatus Woesebacteria bact
MGLFSKKENESFEDEINEEPRKIRDLRPENRRKRTEPVKPWGIKERFVILITLLATVLTSGFLSLSARNFKLPNLPRLSIPKLSLNNLFQDQVIVVGNRGSKVSQEKIENTKKLFKEAVNNYSGIYAFYIYDLNGDYYYGLNYQEIMQAASLIKLPIMYLAMKEGQDKSLIEAMGKRSDNSAFNEMVSVLGKERVNKTISELGMINTSLSENTTTPEEVGMFFVKLYKNEILDKEKSDQLMEYMTNTAFESWLRLGIPEDVPLTHKYGRESGTVNDAGIVLSSKPFVLVIMTDGAIEREADELFPNLTKILYDNHVKD